MLGVQIKLLFFFPRSLTFDRIRITSNNKYWNVRKKNVLKNVVEKDIKRRRGQ